MFRFLTILMLCLSVTSVKAQEFPAPTGHVNDFADILPADLRNQLEAELVAFKDSTTHEIAVVTVPSLQGYSIEEFTIELAQAWGVGGADADNGIVLLYAKAEGGVRIEVGYGLEGVLNDGKAGDIIRDVMVPEKKANGLPAAIVAGTRAIEKILTAPEAPQQPRRPVNTKAILLGMMFFLGAVLLIVLAVLISNAVARQRRTAELVRDCQDRIASLSPKLEPARQMLQTMQARHPTSMFTRFALPTNLCEYERRLKDATRSGGGSEASLIALRTALGSLEVLVSSAQNLPETITEAQRRVPSLQAEITAAQQTTEESIAHPDISEKLRQQLDAIIREKQASLAALNLPANQIDWFVVVEALESVLEDLRTLEDRAAKRIAYAAHAREKGPALLARLEKRLKGSDDDDLEEARSKVADARSQIDNGADWPAVFALLVAASQSLRSYTESQDSYRPSRSYDSGNTPSVQNSPPSGFSGFGGGSFGGGGASGKL